MADETKLSFPNMPVKHWWALRERFKRSLPPTVTPDYLETTLNINESSALPLMTPLKTMGLITQDGKTTDRAERWRHDDTYAEVCAEIRELVYPEELLHAVPDPVQDRAAAERWFAKKLKVGERVSQKLTAIYQIVTEADPNKAPDTTTGTGTPRANKPDRGSPKVRKQTSAGTAPEVSSNRETARSILPTTEEPVTRNSGRTPSVHIDIQIHISAEATTQQIDQIFASMAKHLYKD
jgi:hypothetical protein